MATEEENNFKHQRIQSSKETLLYTMYAMLIITSAVFFDHIGIRLWKKISANSVDIWLSLAYLFFTVHLINYILATPPLYRQDLVAKGIIEIYPDFVEDSRLSRVYIFCNVPLFWATLWSVKMAVLMLYRKIMAGIRLYLILWGITIAVCISTFIVALFFHFFSCIGYRYFDVNGCISPADQKKSQRVVYFSFAADIVTDIMILLLPLNVLRSLQRPLREKIGLAILFLVGFFCPLSAVLRIAKLSESPDFSFVIGWLALWGAVETCVAIVVGCVLGMYVAGKEVYKSRAGTSVARKTGGSSGGWYGKTGASKYANGSRGYNEVGEEGGVVQQVVVSGAKGRDDIEMRRWGPAEEMERGGGEGSVAHSSWCDGDGNLQRDVRLVSRQASDGASLVGKRGEIDTGRAI